MSRNRDNAPIGHTCPTIDRVISFLDRIDWNMEDEVERDLSIDCKDAVKDMEEIRKANDALRTWGNEECKYKEEYEEEKIELVKEVDKLGNDLSDLRDEIKELKGEINTLEDKLSDVVS